jgi:hypothetical protein
MSAHETQSDYTTASGTELIPDFLVLPVGYVYYRDPDRIYTFGSYTDDDFDPDTITPSSVGGSKVNRFVVVGDTEGDEAGTETQVTVYFDALEILIYRVGNCVPPTPLPGQR